jgi:uncharacterized repeat protein (TIGR01451 family)
MKHFFTLLLLTTTIEGFGQCPTANAGPDQTVCSNAPTVPLNGSVTIASGAVWTGGMGSFAPNANTLQATYMPAAAEIAAGIVTLTIRSTGNGSCSEATDMINITILQGPYVTAGSNQITCKNNSMINLNGMAVYSSLETWTSSGSGLIGAVNSPNTTYTPSAQDINAGSVTLTLTGSGTGSCNASSSSIDITFIDAPYVSAGADICTDQNSVALSSATTVSSGIIWTSSGTGTFTTNSTTLNANYVLSAADTAYGEITLTLTSTGNGSCNSVSDSMQITYGSNCSCFGTISGKVYEDNNANGILDNGEKGKPYKMVKLSSSSRNYYCYTDNYGNYSTYVSCNDNYQVQIADTSNIIITSPANPGIYSVSINSSGVSNTGNVDFGCILPPTIDLVIGLQDWGSRRPGFPIHIGIYYANIGTVSVSGVSMSLNFDAKLNYTGTNLSPSSTSGNNLIWNLGTVPAGGSGYFVVDFIIDPSASIGSTIYLDATINPVSGDYDPVNNNKIYPCFLSGAYDPNDKSVQPPGTGLQKNIYKDDHLSYTIRFQNTGTADAINVFVKDTLDTNLDLGTLHTTQASHYYEVSVDSNRVVTWNFPNIHLPDSNSNEQASHGFIQYSIRQNSNNPDGTVIKNKAGIYFDFNAPVITNETMNTIGSNVLTALHTTLGNNNLVSLFPNPSKDQFSVINGSEIFKFSLLDLSGKIVLIGSTDKVIDISRIETGLYILKLEGTDAIYYKKLLIE